MLDSTSAGRAERPAQIVRLTERWRFAADRVAETLARYSYVVLALASAGYFAITCYRAHRRLFWFDEIFTFYIARLPNLGAIWEACTHGVDFNPPLLYLLTKWSQSLFGPTELGTRMPEIVGFWIFCLCLYRFVSVRTNVVAGLIALLFPITAGGYWYAYEARSYGIILGLFGLALISWQAAAHRAPRRWTAVAGLAISLSLAAVCHCYAFLLFIPLGFGEITRTILRKRVDLAVWCAMALPAILSAGFVLPLLRGVNHSLDSGAFRTTTRNFTSGWDLSFQPLLALSLLLLLSGFVALERAFQSIAGAPKPVGAPWTPGWDETAVMTITLCTPVLAFLASRVAHAPLYGRYSLIVLAGTSCFIGAAYARSNTTGLLAISMIISCILAQSAWFYHAKFVAEPAMESEIGTRDSAESFGFALIGSAAGSNDPIVLLDNRQFAAMFFYAPSSIRSRLVFLTPDGNGEGYARLQLCCGAPGNIVSRPKFLAAHPSFFIFSHKDQIASLSDFHGPFSGHIEVLACDSRGCLYRFAATTAH
jgi:hypothetical protein